MSWGCWAPAAYTRCRRVTFLMPQAMMRLSEVEMERSQPLAAIVRWEGLPRCVLAPMYIRCALLHPLPTGIEDNSHMFIACLMSTACLPKLLSPGRLILRASVHTATISLP